ncbi:MAG: sulfate adenylyltransferase [Blastocatellia bacterium]|nr:sulfate adenylyltransferase [Blastocatellia bacterium]
MSNHLITPHGGRLINLLANAERSAQLQDLSRDWISWDLSPRQLCDLELLLCGGFSPLRGFMSRVDYESVCSSMRLGDGTLWPIPIVLDVTEKVAKQLHQGSSIALRDPEGVMRAVLQVEDVWQPDLTSEAESVYGTTDSVHPGVSHLLHRTNTWYVGGLVEGVESPIHYDYRALRQTPAELRAEFARLGWQRVVAFQTRNPIHRAHHELTLRAIKELECNLLVHPVVGLTKEGDVDHYTRIRCYQSIMSYYPPDAAKLSLLPLAMRMAGPREALWHAIIRKNYGCTHFIVGRDHAGPGADSKGKGFYGPYDAQELLRKHEKELGVDLVPFRMMVYVSALDSYVPENEVPEGMETQNISGSDLRRRLSEGLEVPEWFTFPEVAQDLRRTHPARHKQGVTIFFTGLSGSGKSTIANALQVKLLEAVGRPVTLLDGDIVRKNLSSELGFSKEHRDINIRRIGFVASQISKNGGIAICAPIAPYDNVRKEVRAMMEGGAFILVHVATSLEVCEQRDRKGLYAKARAGLIQEFTGISDPYESPADAEVTIDTAFLSPEESAQEIISHLERQGYFEADVNLN